MARRLYWITGVAGLLLALGLGSCVEPYAPDVLNAPNSYLVIDGFINGNGVTRIKLSRTENVATTTAPPAETKATLAIVDEVGGRYPLVEKASGSYQSDSLLLNPARQYQLRITTAGAATYESALVPLKVTPPIDKLDWVSRNDNFDVRLSTHDAQQQSRYYRWGLTETWEFNSAYKSYLEYRNSTVLNRITPIYTCWRTEQTTSIRQGSSAQLSQDAITDFTLLSFSNRAERVTIRYSVLVSQYAQTAAEFAYYELLRKNTEAVGGVNDPLPTQLTGNVHRLDNAAEPVLGFVGAHTIQYKRLFINRADLNLPNTWLFDTPYSKCQLIKLGDVSIPDNVPVDYFVNDKGNIAGYVGGPRACIDCRVRGSNVKPSYW